MHALVSSCKNINEAFFATFCVAFENTQFHTHLARLPVIGCYIVVTELE